jgi:hypothetical protein
MLGQSRGALAGCRMKDSSTALRAIRGRRDPASASQGDGHREHAAATAPERNAYHNTLR